MLVLYIVSANVAHTQICQRTYLLFSISLEAPTFCLHGSTVRDLSLTGALVRVSIVEHELYLEGTELVHMYTVLLYSLFPHKEAAQERQTSPTIEELNSCKD